MTAPARGGSARAAARTRVGRGATGRLRCWPWWAGLCVLSLAAPGALADPEGATALRTADVARHYETTWAPHIAEALSGVPAYQLPDSLPLADDVADGVFALIFGILERDVEAVITGPQLQEMLQRTGRESSVPPELITLVERAHDLRGPQVWVRALFTEALRVAVPYSILGYHPGRLASSQSIIALEWRYSRLTLPDPRHARAAPLELTDVTLWGVVSGEILIDIDGWLDFLLGSKLDDTRVVGLADFRLGGKRFGMALGYNREGEPRSGALDLAENEIRFPSPPEIKAVARHLRARVVRRLAEMGLPVWLPPGS